MAERLTTYDEIAQVLEALPIVCRETRRARRVSMREAARQMGLSFSTVCRIENGEDCVASNLIAVMRWIDGKGSQSAGLDEL